MNILFAEDNRMNRTVAKLLEKAGHTVTLASDGTYVLQLKEIENGGGKSVGAFRSDCILMDVQMPDLDGIETRRPLRAGGIQTPIIALTAKAMKGDRERCLDAGRYFHVVKPFELADISRVLLSCQTQADPVTAT